jgi:membrane-bound metal-dependent hydrolase YbcI (DUF457 family)
MTPIVHTAVGFLGWQNSASKKNIKTLLLFILISNLPDFDFFLFFFIGKKELQLHQSYTHNFLFVVFFTLVFFFFFKQKKERIALFLVSLSHLLLDLIIIDPVDPIGFRLFFPFWNRLFNVGFFPNLLRGSISEIFSWHNVVTISIEMAIFVVPVLLFYRKELRFYLGKKEFWKVL